MPETVAQVCILHMGASIQVETSLSLLAPEIPGSLQQCQKQSQTGPLNSEGSIEVKTGLRRTIW